MPATWRPRASDLDLDKRSYGAGLRFHTRPQTFARIDVAQGNEGWRVPVPPEGSARLRAPQPRSRAGAVCPVEENDDARCHTSRSSPLADVRRLRAPASRPAAGPERASRRRAPACGSSRPTSPVAICTNGPWGAANAPDPKGVYTLVELKHTGVNLGMTVKDSKGREWSVKQPFPGDLDSEAPVEVARVAAAVGHRLSPAAGVYLPAFTLKDDFGTHVEVGGRFRLEDRSAEGNRRLGVGRQSVRRHQGHTRA